jgi:glycosyltransferase involved in cell wall biosynthesis
LLADEPENFARAVIALARTPELRTHLTGAAIELVRANYQWSAISARLREVHEELLAERSSKHR